MGDAIPVTDARLQFLMEWNRVHIQNLETEALIHKIHDSVRLLPKQRVHCESLIDEPVPEDFFEMNLFHLAKRWHKRSVEEISAMCNRMGCTPDQRANAIRAYMAERQRHED